MLVAFHRLVGPAWHGAPDDAGVAAAAAAAHLRAEAATLAPPACPPRGFACGGLNLMPAKASKWQAGVGAVWVGAKITPHFGVVH
eukprot:2174308-Pleurochrysis_carterae.AAC.1